MLCQLCGRKNKELSAQDKKKPRFQQKLNWMRLYDRNQTDQREVLNDDSYMTSALIAFTPKIMLL